MSAQVLGAGGSARAVVWALLDGRSGSRVGLEPDGGARRGSGG